MTINRPENLFGGVTPSPYKQNIRDFPELAEEVGRRAATMSRAGADTAHRERTAYEAIVPGLAAYQRDSCVYRSAGSSAVTPRANDGPSSNR